MVGCEPKIAPDCGRQGAQDILQTEGELQLKFLNVILDWDRTQPEAYE